MAVVFHGRFYRYALPYITSLKLFCCALVQSVELTEKVIDYLKGVFTAFDHDGV